VHGKPAGSQSCRREAGGIAEAHQARWPAWLGDLYRRDRGWDTRAELAELVTTWETLAALIDLHMRADEEICGPAVFGGSPAGRAMTRQVRDDHEDIREILRQASLQPPGSPPWWHLARTAWPPGPRSSTPNSTARWPGAAAPIARCGNSWPASGGPSPTRTSATGTRRHRRRSPRTGSGRTAAPPLTVPRLADPRFGPLACTCRACTRTLEWVLFRQPKHVPQRPAPAR